ncbi:MAG TPA: peptidoglycan-binding domain-containing protein [Conexibacter sp.]|nr:peptidoglycan-binding domain-containing protein [Conexibacter sp.]
MARRRVAAPMNAARLRILLLATLLSALVVPSAHAVAGAASAPRDGHPRIVFIRCSSDPYPCASHKVMTRTGKMLVGAGGMSRHAKVVFPVRSRAGGRIGLRAVGGRFRTSTRVLVRVPGDAISGPIRVVNPRRKFSNAVRIHVRDPPPRRPTGGSPAPGPSAFDGSGMWIWYLSKSEGGDPAAIAAQAFAHGVNTVFVKSADGTGAWSQFNATAVAALKATGLRVCGWQFVYGNEPVKEATAAAAAKDAGADCFVIDAEGAYEGKYAQAQRYMTKLRELVGSDFPIGLTSFPYVDFHPGLPYSVFMAPGGGATFNLPQVYWKTIGDSVDASLAHTYQWNLPYETAIFPLGQTYDRPKAIDVERFRQLSGAYGAHGVSWWVWQFASDSDWDALGAPIDPVDRPETLWPTLHAGSGGKVGSKGDLVVWAQQHLVGAGEPIGVDGQFGPGTAQALADFQTTNGLPATGQLDAATWPVLLKVAPAPVDWVAQASASASRARASAARVSAADARDLPPGLNGPASAALPAKRDEIPPGPRR